MKPLFFLTILVFGLHACASDASPETFIVSFYCESVGTKIVPSYDIYAIINESKVKVANAPNCDEIKPMEYKKLAIPADVVAVSGGTWDGYGVLVYAQKVKQEIRIFQSEIDKGVKGSDYRLVATFKDGKFSFEARK
ncbi:MAG: hypothetical protein DHS20C18_02950 [Saprospiraceae bacterium]|nr:MAG: hypothetical protein DHS20C18_02950 [Saprospiraceae bacterium]